MRPQDFDAVVNASAVAAAILGELRWREAALDVEYYGAPLPRGSTAP